MVDETDTAVGRIAQRVVTDVHGLGEQLPAVAEALGNPSRPVRLTATWALAQVAEFYPDAIDTVAELADDQTSVESGFLQDVLAAQRGITADDVGSGPEGPGTDPVIDGIASGMLLDHLVPEPSESEGSAAGDGGVAGTGQVTLGTARDTLHPDAVEAVEIVVDEIWQAPRELPSLLALLDHDHRQVRLTAAWAVAMVAEHHPANVSHLAARASDHDSQEARLLVGMLDYYHDASASAGAGTAQMSRPERRLEENLWGPYLTYPMLDDQVVAPGSNTLVPDSSPIEAVNAIDLVGLSRHERVYVSEGTVNGEFQKFLLHTYVPRSEYAIKDYQRDFKPVFEGWTEVDGLRNVATVLDHGRTPHPWVATEYLPRPLWRSGRLQTRGAVELGVQLADTVATMHQGGTAHGGISPWTVGLVRSDEYVPKLTRVGIGAHVGTPRTLRIDERFAPPEAMSDDYGSVGRLTDVYGLGVTLFAMLTGEAPPHTRDADGNFVPADVPDPSSVVDYELPTALDEIVQTATAPQKPWRYESVARIAEALRSVLTAHG